MSTERKQRPVKPIPEAMDSAATVELERGWRPIAAVTAILAGILPVIGLILQTIASRGIDDDVDRVVSVSQALTRYGAGDAPNGIAGRQADIVSHYGDQWLTVAAAAVCTGLGLLLAIPVLYGLIRAAWRRRPSFPRWFLWTPAVGGVLFAVATVVALIYQAVQYHDFTQMAAAAQNNGAANDALNAAQDDLSFLQFAGGIGSLFTAVGFGAAALSAMNVGLLTRVIGSIGVLMAFLVVIPLLGPQGNVLRGFWFVAVGLTLLGRWPGGRPPAWDSGEPMPWPSRAQVLEEAERAGAGRSKGPDPTDAPAPKPKASSGGRRKRRK
ncbi:hypothetical protein [Patulibacter sp.]|uniref:hypothetical protein n=1 Tax=Patulibacter sp. TaxID=1912859 RepID=UPI00271E76EF|nr:hypothetical protein [Patulibacter sp.]MDO9410022.1 hypothetical protein [Patulibacter sp.]